MYLRIGLRPNERQYHRFLWRDLDDTAASRVYEFQRMVFGANASPFLAQFVSHEQARAHQQQYPLAAETWLASTYMDDSMDSAMDDVERVMLYEQLSECWQGADMHARKWLSNSKVVMEKVPKEDRASQIDVDSAQLASVKALGLLWSATTETFAFKPTAAMRVENLLQFGTLLVAHHYFHFLIVTFAAVPFNLHNYTFRSLLHCLPSLFDTHEFRGVGSIRLR